MEPDRRVVVTEMHHNIMDIFVAQGVRPAVSTRQVTGREQHNLVELADPNRARDFDVTGGEARGRIKRRRGRKDFNAYLLAGCETENVSQTLVALFQHFTEVRYQRGIFLRVKQDAKMRRLQGLERGGTLDGRGHKLTVGLDTRVRGDLEQTLKSLQGFRITSQLKQCLP